MYFYNQFYDPLVNYDDLNISFLILSLLLLSQVISIHIICFKTSLKVILQNCKS